METNEHMRAVLDAHAATLVDTDQINTFAAVRRLVERTFDAPPTTDHEGLLVTNPFVARDVQRAKQDKASVAADTTTTVQME